MGPAGGRGAPPTDPPGVVRVVVVENIFELLFSENGHLSFAIKAQVAAFWIFFKNGSPGQMAILDRSGSKFCVEPGSRNPDISHMSQNPIWKLQK